MPSNDSYPAPAKSFSSLIDELVAGFKAFFAGLSLLLRNRSLIWLSLIPILGTLALIALLATGSVWLVNGWLANAPAEMRVFLQTLVLLLALFIGLSLYLPIARVLFAPFSEALCRKTIEVAGLGWVQLERPSALRAIWEGVKLVSLQLVILVIGGALSFILPVIGHFLWIVVLIVLCGMDYLDVPLSARGLTLREKLNLLWKHKVWAFGFGLAGYLMLFVPVVNLLSLPVGIIGATLLTSRMRA